ncbi:ABC transporter ATP-binding protein [Nisaea sp.]|uniref:ABC transporter ATP-binding protein n=1 Tax=Nisaea sp. TaxID=2024842 RepID=UPI003B521380
MSKAVIDVRNLEKRYGTVHAVRGVTFSVEAGTTMGLLGGNGAGKTTTIAMMLGLLEPTGGGVSILGCDMATERYRALPFMNFSSPYVDLPHRLTVRENLRIYAGLYSVPGPKDRIAELAEQLHMEDFMNRPSGKLSAGQKTRVALAKALINTPKVLLLDEPTASLDPDTGDWIRTYLENYQQITGATILLASHNMQEVERLCREVLMMRQGTIVDRGGPAELLAKYGRKTMDEVFLDVARRTGAANGNQDEQGAA